MAKLVAFPVALKFDFATSPPRYKEYEENGKRVSVVWTEPSITVTATARNPAPVTSEDRPVCKVVATKEPETPAPKKNPKRRLSV